MKSTAIILTAVLCAVFTNVVQGQDLYFHSSDSAVALQVDSNRVLLKQSGIISRDDLNTIMDQIDRIAAVVPDSNIVGGFAVCSLLVTHGYFDFLDSLRQMSEIAFAEPYYRIGSSPAIVGDRIACVFDSSLPVTERDSIIDKLNLTLDHEFAGIEGCVILQNTESSNQGLVDLANELHDIAQTVIAFPSFAMRLRRDDVRPYDYYSSYQVHLQRIVGPINTPWSPDARKAVGPGPEPTIWDFAGLERPVLVAVLDDGFVAHEDLPASRIVSGYDYGDNDWDVTPRSDFYHGIACAGVIGASNTYDSIAGQTPSTGVASVNPSSRLMALKIFPDNGNIVYEYQVAEAIAYAYLNEAEVLNCSWSHAWPLEYPLVSMVLERATIFGRDGKGCVNVFSSGNRNSEIEPHSVRYPARLPYCIAVGAVDL